MKTFYGRDRERKLLSRELSRAGQSAALILGRRRIGKSALIKRVLAETPELRSVYYECKQASERNNTESLAAVVGDVLGIPTPAFSSFEGALDFLFTHAANEKTVLVLDEYQYLRGTIPGIDSILQALIDKHADDGSMKLILCGSYVDVMKSLLLADAPLYGRIDLTIDVKAMDYYDAALFYPGFSDEDKVRLYSVFGGVPYYNRLIDPALSVRENILELIAGQDARLENEIEIRLRSEIAKFANANEVFETLARGFSRFNDILSQSGVSSSPTLADVLEKLVRMGMVNKEAPINTPENRRKAGYYLADPLTHFFYRYVARYASQRSVLDPDVFYDRFVDEDFETKYVPKAFETICKEYLVRRNRAGKIDPPFEAIGKYYYDDPVTRRNGEFDVVGRRPDGYAFYEAKFRARPVDPQTVRVEREQIEQAGLPVKTLGFFSRSGFRDLDDDDGLELVSLAELYARGDT